MFSLICEYVDRIPRGILPVGTRVKRMSSFLVNSFRLSTTSITLGQLVLPERRELVLDYIVERKRMDDLCSSIKDGRFKEQKVSCSLFF